MPRWSSGNGPAARTLRAPVYKGLRTDTDPAAVVLERPGAPPGRRLRQNGRVRVSAKADYAVRAMLELADGAEDSPCQGRRIADDQDIPLRFLENILAELRYAGLVRGRPRGRRRLLARPAPEEITLAEIIREVDGPLATRPRQAAGRARLPGRREAPPGGVDRAAGKHPRGPRVGQPGRPGRRPAAGAGPRHRQPSRHSSETPISPRLPAGAVRGACGTPRYVVS